MYDLLIIGGGPAGLSAAMTARNRNLSVCVICGGAADSALYKAGHVTNYPGVPDVSGPALLETMTQQARALGADILDVRRLGGQGIRGGQGAAAGDRYCPARHVSRGNRLSRPRSELLRHLRRHALPRQARGGHRSRGGRAGGGRLPAGDYDGKKHRFEIRGTERADALMVDGTAEPADVVFILRAGFAADTLLPGLATDNGHIVVDDDCAASIPGVFAAGDCTGAPYQIPAAVGEGNRAALSVVRWLRNA